MSFRHRIFRIIAVLVFSFELLAPALFAPSEHACEAMNNQRHLVESGGSLDLLSHLIFEEVNNEESREGKEHGFTQLWFTEVFSVLQKFEPANVTWPLPKERFNTQPSLFTLHRVLLI
jgi:hypothetical protein